ncbi:MAG: DUF1343 domain-containing protein [Chitinivibrionales bacterium]|nr:DUF1343 domain-containing protein [Chitinivibrionales bacterium]
MVKTGLEIFLSTIPDKIKGKRVGVLCHAASVTSKLTHIIDELAACKEISLGAIFGPQHGLAGQTQDNMVEWEGALHPRLKIPVYSLYGQNRKPTPAMLQDIDALIIDLQDVGARPYTYIWTIKLCLEACAEQNRDVWILDRPNPIAAVQLDGPLLQPEYFSFVGGAAIPLCHRMTVGEIAEFMHARYFPKASLQVIRMEGWWRDSLWPETELPWVMPSPNMPTLDTAVVYPGMVLLEATNCSEGRGTTRPFELFGAPYLVSDEFARLLQSYNLPGCIFREHGLIPILQKWQGVYCNGMQIHVTDARRFLPVATAAAILGAIMQTSSSGFAFKEPPYEYETVKQPFDILAGSGLLRHALLKQYSLLQIMESWRRERFEFERHCADFTFYPERLS